MRQSLVADAAEECAALSSKLPLLVRHRELRVRWCCHRHADVVPVRQLVLPDIDADQKRTEAEISGCFLLARSAVHAHATANLKTMAKVVQCHGADALRVVSRSSSRAGVFMSWWRGHGDPESSILSEAAKLRVSGSSRRARKRNAHEHLP